VPTHDRAYLSADKALHATLCEIQHFSSVICPEPLHLGQVSHPAFADSEDDDVRRLAIGRNLELPEVSLVELVNCVRFR
jgi:hypothetical protein